jgi:hypothetical protein
MALGEDRGRVNQILMASSLVRFHYRRFNGDALVALFFGRPVAQVDDVIGKDIDALHNSSHVVK